MKKKIKMICNNFILFFFFHQKLRDQELKEFEKHRQNLKKQQYEENQDIGISQNPNEDEYCEENNNQDFANNADNEGQYFEDNYNDNLNKNDNENNENFNEEEQVEINQNNNNNYDDTNNNNDENLIINEPNKEININDPYENQQCSEPIEESNNNEEEPSNQALYGSKNRSNNYICPDEDKSEGSVEKEAKSEGKLFEKKTSSPQKPSHTHKKEEENAPDPNFFRILQLEMEITTGKFN